MKHEVSIEELVFEAEARKCPISEVVIEREVVAYETDREQLVQKMSQNWQIMKKAVEHGIKEGTKSFSGLVGEEGKLLFQYSEAKEPLSGKGTVLAAARALGVAGVNASMGRIVAAPTAGSCGILPGVIQTVSEHYGSSEHQIIKSMFTAAGIGMVIDQGASISGAEGGCQAECGAASSMAAAAAVELAGGTPRQAAHAAAIALKNVLGLVCDPVAGLVEVPCVKRNASGTANALIAADMALAGIESRIPFDEVIEAMSEVGRLLPNSLKETALGGLANTPTAREIEKQLYK